MPQKYKILDFAEEEEEELLHQFSFDVYCNLLMNAYNEYE